MVVSKECHRKLDGILPMLPGNAPLIGLLLWVKRYLELRVAANALTTNQVLNFVLRIGLALVWDNSPLVFAAR
ncbi:hypothetical protein JOE11_003620 [Robbsia andropogonis]